MTAFTLLNDGSAQIYRNAGLWYTDLGVNENVYVFAGERCSAVVLKAQTTIAQFEGSKLSDERRKLISN